MQTEVLKVSGMFCGGCLSKVTKALKSINGVDEVNVSLVGGEARVQFDANLTTSAQLTAAVKEAGYGVAAAQSQSVPAHQGKDGCCG